MSGNRIVFRSINAHWQRLPAGTLQLIERIAAEAGDPKLAAFVRRGRGGSQRARAEVLNWIAKNIGPQAPEPKGEN